MAYVFRQKLNINDLVDHLPVAPKVLVAEIEPELGKMYCMHLADQKLQAHHCNLPDRLHIMLKEVWPDVLVCGTDFFQDHDYLVVQLDFVRKQHPLLKIITIGENLGVAEMKQLMRYGISGHLEKQLTRPTDVALIVRGLLGF
jgi:DNA-binding NtrC family response regulator